MENGRLHTKLIPGRDNRLKAPLSLGDIGLWVTCARGMEQKASRELQLLLDSYGKLVYDIQSADEEWADKDQDGDEDDIELQVQKEIASLKAPAAEKNSAFTLIHLGVECLLFVKTQPPVNPVELAHKICQDAMNHALDYSVQNGKTPSSKTPRCLNRFTPITASGRATEKGLVDVANQILPAWFTLKKQSTNVDDKEKAPCSYAIRLTRRQHHVLQRDVVIKQIAELIDSNRHAVNLNNPDKVILVEIFKATIGMSVVDGDYGALKKYNIWELCNDGKSSNDMQTPKSKETPEGADTKATTKATEEKPAETGGE